MAVPGDDVDK